MKIPILVILVLQVCYALHPLVLVPGYLGSRLDATLHKTSSGHLWCEKTASKYTIWLSTSQLLPFAINCFVDNMKLTYDMATRRTYDAEGVKISVPGFGDTRTIEHIDPHQIISAGNYYNEMVEFFVARGYERNKTIRGAPYDFRRAPNEHDAYFDRLKKMIEQTYANNNNTKLVLVGHSMGCDMILRFLSAKVDQEWKYTHIKAFVSLAGPYAGSAGSLLSMISGTNFGSTLIKPKSTRPFVRSESSTASFLPSDRAWGRDEVLVSTPTANYTVNTYPQFFKDIDYETGKEMWIDTKNLIKNNTVPGVEVHCLYGIGKKTLERLEYGAGFPDSKPTALIYGDGDGSVNRRSLDFCKRWSKYQKQQFFHKMYPNVSHGELVKNSKIFEYILGIVTK